MHSPTLNYNTSQHASFHTSTLNQNPQSSKVAITKVMQKATNPCLYCDGQSSRGGRQGRL
jgi:hypothetical protein